MNILFYGDSNTYGQMPSSFDRFDEKTRFTSIIKNSLGARVKEDGIPGRTSVYSSYRGLKPAYDDIVEAVLSGNDLDYFVFMLGTNDLKIDNARTKEELFMGLNMVIKKAQGARRKETKLVFVCPVALPNNMPEINSEYDEVSVSLSRELPSIYQELAKRHKGIFINSNMVAKASEDGEHLTKEGHRALANEIMKYLK